MAALLGPLGCCWAAPQVRDAPTCVSSCKWRRETLTPQYAHTSPNTSSCSQGVMKHNACIAASPGDTRDPACQRSVVVRTHTYTTQTHTHTHAHAQRESPLAASRSQCTKPHLHCQSDDFAGGGRQEPRLAARRPIVCAHGQRLSTRHHHAFLHEPSRQHSARRTGELHSEAARLRGIKWCAATAVAARLVHRLRGRVRPYRGL